MERYIKLNKANEESSNLAAIQQNDALDNDSALSRVIEHQTTEKKSIYKPQNADNKDLANVHKFERHHKCLGNVGLPAEAAYMDLNPSINMFRRLRQQQ